LTINLELQEFIHSIFPRNKAGAVVVMNPRTGGVLSYNSFPEFDQNWFTEGITQAQWDYLRNHESRPLLDRVVMGTYPPGSTFKIMSAAYNFERNLVSETTRLSFCGGGMQIGDRFFRCWNRHGHGRTSFLDAMAMSCNVYFFDLSSRFSLDDFVDFSWNSFIFDRTGIDLPSERSGFMPRTEWYRNRLGRFFSTLGIRANLAIGQGEVLVSPLAICAFYAAIANDGVWRTPHLFKEAFNDTRRLTQEILTKEKRLLPFNEYTLRLIQQSMYHTVYSNTGTGRHIRVNNATIFAKTGSSENPHGDLPHASIAGYAKWDGMPEIAFYVIVENAGHGGSVAGPIARQIIQFYQDRIRPTNVQIAQVSGN
jgi:penicillin-binding protein 2